MYYGMTSRERGLVEEDTSREREREREREPIERGD